ncbi:MAG TPA: hypothetical protein VGJ06_14715 [Candidatus Acidoferrum sp.]
MERTANCGFGAMREKAEQLARRVERIAIALILVSALCARPAYAHVGPPFPIISDQTVGPVVVSLWTHPDVGTGTFFVLVNPLPGKSIPKDLKMQIGIAPVSGRLAEVVYPTWIENLRGQLEYKNQVEFDRDEMWKVRLIVTSADGGGEATAQVEATPPGFGQWDLLLFALPFLAVGFLWFKVMAKRRKARSLQTAQG